MALYKCDCCNKEKEVHKAKIIYKDNKWVSDVICEFGKYMYCKPNEGMPNIIRTEESLSKKKKHDKLWDSAKEKLVGEKGVNENY